MESEKSELSTNKILAAALTLVLASSGTTVGVQQYFGGAEVRKLNDAIESVVDDLNRLHTDPNARADAWSRTQAVTANGYQDKRHSDTARRIDLAIQELRTHIETIQAGVRERGSRIGSISKQVDTLINDESEQAKKLNNHLTELEHEGANRRMSDHDKRLDRLEDLTGVQKRNP